MTLQSSIRYAESMARTYSEWAAIPAARLAKARNTDPRSVASARMLESMFTAKAQHYAQIASRLRAYASPDNLEVAR